MPTDVTVAPPRKRLKLMKETVRYFIKEGPKMNPRNTYSGELRRRLLRGVSCQATCQGSCTPTCSWYTGCVSGNACC